MVIHSSLGLALALACGGDQDPVGPSRQVAQAELSQMQLSYVCGNTIRVRNPIASAVRVTWVVVGEAGERGTLILPPKPAGADYSETYFTTVNQNTVRLYSEQKDLLQSVANGHTPPCQVSSDTTRPPLPTSTNWPTLNPLLVTSPANPSFEYFRNVFGVAFDDSTSGTTVRAFLDHFQATIIGGFGGEGVRGYYVVSVPDPGATMEAVHSISEAMDVRPGVAHVLRLSLDAGLRMRSRLPVDSAVATRGRQDDGTGAQFEEAAALLRQLPQIEESDLRDRGGTPRYLNPTDGAAFDGPSSESKELLQGAANGTLPPCTVGTVPALPPDTIPAWFGHDSSYAMPDGFLKNVVWVFFREGTTQLQRQEAVSLVNGAVIGGMLTVAGDGFYFLCLQDDGNGTQLEEAAGHLRRLPQVEEADLEYREGGTPI